MTRVSGLFLLIACTAAVAGPDQGGATPGKWKYTMKVEVGGVSMPPGGITQTVCLGEEEAKYGVARVEDGQKGACQFENWRRAGNVISFDMVCPDSQDVSGAFEYTVSGASVTGKGVIRSGGSEIIQRWQGTRVGDC